jgi:hypothetical protein
MTFTTYGSTKKDLDFDTRCTTNNFLLALDWQCDYFTSACCWGASSVGLDRPRPTNDRTITHACNAASHVPPGKEHRERIFAAMVAWRHLFRRLLCADAMIFFAFFQNLFQISSASFLHPKQEIVAALVALA